MLEGPTKLLCEDTSPTTGRRCDQLASITFTRFGASLNLCAECALREYLRQHSVGSAVKRRMDARALEQRDW